MIDVGTLLQMAADKSGFARERYEQRRYPTHQSLVTVILSFGDLRSTAVSASLLMRRYREEVKGSRYFIVAGWPGMAGLFPYADEYWGIADASLSKKLYASVTNFGNKSDLLLMFKRELHGYFEEVLDGEVLSPFYHNGLTPEYWETFKKAKRYLPMIPSAGILPRDFNRELITRPGYKVFVWPHLFGQGWKHGSVYTAATVKDFWVALVERLLQEKMVPVLYRNPLAHDLSPEFTDRCVYYSGNDIIHTCGVMRAVGCVLDLFNGSSRLALVGRCPFVSTDERSRYNGVQEYEMDDLCGPAVPKQYIFSFATIIEGGDPGLWNSTLFDNVVARLHTFLPDLNRDNWPTPLESFEEAPYGGVRQHKSKRIGTKLFRMPKDD